MKNHKKELNQLEHLKFLGVDYYKVSKLNKAYLSTTSIKKLIKLITQDSKL